MFQRPPFDHQTGENKLRKIRPLIRLGFFKIPKVKGSILSGREGGRAIRKYGSIETSRQATIYFES
jgi:hypothetical protein